MRITDSNVEMAAVHVKHVRREQRTEVRVWSAGSPAPVAPQAPEAQSASAPDPCGKQGLCTREQLHSSLMAMMLEKLLGREVRIARPDWQQRECDLPQVPDPAAGPQRPPEPGWGMQIDTHHRYEETEQTVFAARAEVHTADGRTVRLDLELGMSRQYVQQESLQIRAGAALKDPLVINFQGNAAELTDQTLRFDIDADGQADTIHRLGPASGFLAWDRDGSGRIEDGSELFGPSSGDGFAELAGLDADGDGWIDEDDAAFDVLRIWTPDGQGGGRLVGLAAVGVGAIGLARVATPFDLTGPDNALRGQVRSTGVVLFEDGTAGTSQQIDLAV
jgi:hypothetical protein